MFQTINAGFPLLSVLIFAPLVVAVILALLPNKDGQSDKLIKQVAIGASVLELLGTIAVFMGFQQGVHGFQFYEKLSWIPQFKINYAVGVDGVSVLLVLLAGILFFISTLVAYNTVNTRVKEYFVNFFILLATTIGVFVALDMFLFYILWEAMLIPAYLMIGIWGGSQRVMATTKFFIYTLASSLFMLVGIVMLYVASGYYTPDHQSTFDMITLLSSPYGGAFQVWVFLAFLIAFAVKAPMFPFHTWLPDAYTQAPFAVSILLAGILSKMGAYGLIRFCITMFPDASKSFSVIIMTLSVIAIIYGAVVAIMQTDMKRMIAYSSFSHIGFITLGIFAFNAQGIGGAVIQMFNHGVIIAGLFALAAFVAARTGTTVISEMTGLAKIIPVTATITMIFVMASVGLPGLNGFTGEFPILMGAYLYSKPLGVIATSGVIIGVTYILYMYHRVFWGENKNESHAKVADLRATELIALAPLLLLVFWVGIYPAIFLGAINTTSVDLATMLLQHNPVDLNSIGKN